MTFTERAWERTAPIRAAIDELPFIRALADGSLTGERFGYYLGQDALYLGQYARVLAGAAALATDPDELVFWAERARDAIVVERSLHAQHVDLAAGAAASPSCAAYTSFLLARRFGEYGVLAAAVLPCFWIYQDVGASLLAVAGDPSAHPYGDWIGAYADPAFAEQTLRVRAIVDREAAAGGGPLRERMLAAYEQASRYEWMFWDAAWRMEGWPVRGRTAQPRRPVM
ncbi:TenA family protein [uncultured Propionibacterium sp.]|uniref:TenA family protein n=1 Tax=uncultured Propionibacterium sp. TaxID=218066 RepID=UPI00293088EF|nr:TenA family protein [uncultured Propionibacterium sp.]